MRPKQWTKNVFVWAAIVFDVKLFQVQPFLRTLLTFVLFCLISGAVYIINDLVDLEKDRLHPREAGPPAGLRCTQPASGRTRGRGSSSSSACQSACRG